MKNKVPFWFKAIYVLSIVFIFYFFLPPSIEEKVISNDKTVKINKEAYSAVPRDLISNQVKETFVGELTGYGPDCEGCGGTVNGGEKGGRLDVTNGKIYYNDSTFGEVRILAADSKYKFGTIIRITVPNVYNTPILGVVLDRGGVIKGNRLDLLFENETATHIMGRQKNVKFEVLRYGW